jgi:hypothetical protein
MVTFKPLTQTIAELDAQEEQVLDRVNRWTGYVLWTLSLSILGALLAMK